MLDPLKKPLKGNLKELCSNSEARILGQDAGARRSRRGIGPLGLSGSFWGSGCVAFFLGFRVESSGFRMCLGCRV